MKRADELKRSDHDMENVSKRFMAKVNKTDTCWIWTAAMRNGYGAMALRPRLSALNAQRVSWLIHKGDVPSGMGVLHKCDNRACVNPDHLFLGTQKDNMVDMSKKGRARNANTILSPENVIRIRKLRKDLRLTLNGIAMMFGVSDSTIKNIVYGTHWRSVQ